METQPRTGNVRRRRSRRRTHVRWGRFGAFLVVVWALVTLVGVEWRIVKAQRQISDLERQIEVEEERAALLDAEIAYRDTNEYIELVARRELGLVKPGEVPVLHGVSR